MSKFTSKFAGHIESMLEYMEAIGRSRSSYESTLLNFDRFCCEKFPCETKITKEVAVEWMKRRPKENAGGLAVRAGVLRRLCGYVNSMGGEAYVLPEKYTGGKSAFEPYIFTGEELNALFKAADKIEPEKNNPLKHLIIPVIFRLIYTCGLRPNEGRELKRRNIYFETGEILITETKMNKERIVVMSGDMLLLCRKYDTARNIFFNGGEYFFPSADGGVCSAQWLQNQFKFCWEQANSGRNISALPSVRVYDLRHRFASAVLNRWLDSKTDLYAKLPYLRSYMGHKNMSETAYYIHLLPENLAKSPGIDWSAFDEIIPEVSVCPEE